MKMTYKQAAALGKLPSEGPVRVKKHSTGMVLVAVTCDDGTDHYMIGRDGSIHHRDDQSIPMPSGDPDD